MPRFRKVAGFKSASALVDHAAAIGARLPLGVHPPQQSLSTGWSFRDLCAGEFDLANRFTVLPMEGWDGGEDGMPTERVRRRWHRVAESGAKLLWLEATAVRPEGRANARQLMLDARTAPAIGALRREVLARHAGRFGAADPPVVGIQLTHSGRWSRPEGAPAPRVVYRHPELDARVGVTHDGAILSDAELDALVGEFVRAAQHAHEAGFDFVDVKHCHGYLGHELLSGYDRPGPYGGSLENRTRFLASVIDGIRERCPGLAVAVRLSAFDFRPFRPGADEVGEPEGSGRYTHAFGASETGLDIDFGEIESLLARFVELGVGLVCVSGGSPYYNPHVMRPAFYPPSDGYQPPEDPVAGVARLLDVTRAAKASFPTLGIVGSGLTYLQQHLPEVAAGAVENGWMDSVGIGRMALSYPGLPADVLAGRALARKLICRTFSDCTTAPRNGLVSGCYPLDDAYRASEEYAALRTIKRGK